MTTQKTKVLTMADIEAAKDIEYARVPGFKPGEEFVLQTLTAGDLIEWSEANDGEAKRTAGLRLIIKSLVDGEPGVDEGAQGVQIASDKDLATFRRKSHKITERLVKEILKLNGMSVKDDAAAKNA